MTKEEAIRCIKQHRDIHNLYESRAIKISEALDMAIEALKAQPEIVRCKDCKYYGRILYSGTQFEYGECFGHEESDYTFEVKPDDFCSRAERRTDD